MSEIGAVVGFLILMALLWWRIAAERREEERETHSAANALQRALPWQAPQVVDAGTDRISRDLAGQSRR